MSDLVTTPSGLVVPKSAAEASARENAARLHDAFLLYPHAREYQPGQSKNTGDTRVRSLNIALRQMCENVQAKSKLFAAFHENNQRIAPSGLWGVVLWSVDEQGCGRVAGNINLAKTGDKDKVGVCEPIGEILKFYIGMVTMDWSASDKGRLMNFYDEMTGNTAKKREAAAALQEHNDVCREEVLTQAFEDVPTRPDRTLPEARGKKKRIITSEVKESEG